MDDALILVVVAAVAGVWYVTRPTVTDPNWVDDASDDNAPDVQDWINQGSEAATGIFESTDEMTASQNLAAFLYALRFGEGTSGPDGYRIKYGMTTFDSYAKHPALDGWRGGALSDVQCAGAGFGPGCVSTAAGAYQFTRPTWVRLAAKLNLPDFSPSSQDRAAVELIREKGALGDVQAGRVDVAISKVRKVWASLPGAGYAGQREVTALAFNTNYSNAGGTVA